jgi:hypothetical protein
VFTEDERLVLKEVRDLFDWTQPLEEPAVAAVIGDAEAAGHARLGELEAAMIRLPLDYRFISAPAEARPGETVIDARKPLDLKAYSSLDSLPASLRERIPFRLSPGWSSSYCIARGRKSMLAYIYNTIGKVETSFYLGAALQRSPGPASLGLEFLNLPEGTFTLYDLVEKKAVRQGRASSRQGFAVEFTSHDYLLLVRGH